MPSPVYQRPPWIAGPLPPARNSRNVRFPPEDAQRVTGDYAGNDLSQDRFPTRPPSPVPVDIPARLSRSRGRIAWLTQFVDPVTGEFDWLAAFAMLLDHIDHKVFFLTQPFVQGVAVTVIRPQEDRRYLFIQNNHATNTLFVGFGFAPSAVNSLTIGPGGFYEPLWVPQNEIQFASNLAGTNGTILYANA